MLQKTQSLVDTLIESEKQYHPADLCSGYIKNTVLPLYTLVTKALNDDLVRLLENQSIRLSCPRSVILSAALVLLIERYDDQKRFCFTNIKSDSNMLLSLVNLEYNSKSTGYDFIHDVNSAFAAGRDIVVDSDFENEIKQNRMLQQYFRVISNFELHSDIQKMIKVAKLCKTSVFFSVKTTDEIIIGYDSDRIESEYVDQIACHYVNILNALTSGLSQQIGTLDLLLKDEIQRAIITWNETSPINQHHYELSSMFDTQCVKDADALAIVSERMCLTFSELNNRVSSLASRLFARGVITESPVAVCMDRSVEHIVSMLAIIKCNATYIPVDMNSLPQEQVRIVLDDCKPVILLTTEKYIQGLQLNNIPVVNVTSQYD
ncbi:MAG TPA: AMP-binding protein, partial [Chitinispirillaceae bacterium]|nr:AMP-binding protein [Chitinispirillaceae bacterium]